MIEREYVQVYKTTLDGNRIPNEHPVWHITNARGTSLLCGVVIGTRMENVWKVLCSFEIPKPLCSTCKTLSASLHRDCDQKAPHAEE